MQLVLPALGLKLVATVPEPVAVGAEYWRVTIVVASVSPLFDVLDSPLPETLAELVMLDGALADTSTVTVTTGYAEPAPSASLRVQPSGDSEQSHPVPMISVAVSWLGNVSTSVTVPDVGV